MPNKTHKPLFATVLAAALLQSCSTLSGPKQFTNYDCPVPYSELAKADQYIYSLEYVPSYSSMLRGHAGLTQPYLIPEHDPEIDPAWFPFARVYISEDLYGPALMEMINHERCHVYQLFSAMDRTNNPDEISAAWQDSINHVGWKKFGK